MGSFLANMDANVVVVVVVVERKEMAITLIVSSSCLWFLTNSFIPKLSWNNNVFLNKTDNITDKFFSSPSLPFSLCQGMWVTEINKEKSGKAFSSFRFPIVFHNTFGANFPDFFPFIAKNVFSPNFLSDSLLYRDSSSINEKHRF